MIGEKLFTNVYINNIDQSITEEELRFMCEFDGRRVRSIVLITDEQGRSKGYGFCNFETHEDAVSAIKTLNVLGIGPKKITASPATSKLEREKFRSSVHKAHSPSENPHIYVKNLDYAVVEEDLRRLFCPFGHIINVRIMRNKIGQSKGFGFVSFENCADAQRAVAELNGIKIGKLCVSMDFYESKETRFAAKPNNNNNNNNCTNETKQQQQISLAKKSFNENQFSKVVLLSPPPRQQQQQPLTSPAFADQVGTTKITSIITPVPSPPTVTITTTAEKSLPSSPPLGSSSLPSVRGFGIEIYVGPGLLNDEKEVSMLFYDFSPDRYTLERVLNHRGIFTNKWRLIFNLKSDMNRALVITEHLFVRGKRVIAKLIFTNEQQQQQQQQQQSWEETTYNASESERSSSSSETSSSPSPDFLLKETPNVEKQMPTEQARCNQCVVAPEWTVPFWR